jgi:hypothetical protein
MNMSEYIYIILLFDCITILEITFFIKKKKIVLPLKQRIIFSLKYYILLKYILKYIYKKNRAEAERDVCATSCIFTISNNIK